MIKEFVFCNYMAWVHHWEDADQQERTMITDLIDAIVKQAGLIGAPPLVVDFMEQNLKRGITTLQFRIATMDGGVCVLGIPPKTLFQTMFCQKYHAWNHVDSSENYSGKITGGVFMEGVWDERNKCHASSAFVEIVQEVVCGNYYRKILEHYPEWKTRYVDSPILVSTPADHV